MQIIAVFFSLILTTGITGAFSSVPVYAASKDKIDVEVWFVTSTDGCSDRNQKALDNYTWITDQYLSQYNIYPISHVAACVPEKYLTEYLDERSPELLVIIPDAWNSLKWLYTKNREGHFYYNGMNNVIVSQAISPYVESKSATWVLSHELAHFALFHNGYPREVYGEGVHVMQAAYDRCKNEDATGAFCPQLWSTVKTLSGKTYPVMEPIYTEDYSPQTSSSSSSTTSTSKVETWFHYLMTPTKVVANGYQTVNAGDRVIFSGVLYEKASNGALTPIAGAPIQIVDHNKFITSEKSYIPLIGKGVTDSSGKFSISWNAIKHTGFVRGDSSMWTPVAHFYGDSKYSSSKEMGNQFWVKDLPKVQVPKDKDGDGILDNVDRCINAPETYNGNLDTDGCPDVEADYVNWEIIIDWAKTLKPLKVLGTENSFYYYIGSGNVLEIKPDYDGRSLIYKLKNTSMPSGFAAALPKNLFDTINPFGNEQIFVLVDGQETKFHVVDKGGSKMLYLYYEAGAKKIEIIGTGLNLTPANSNEPIKEKSQFRAFGETSDGVSLSLSKHAIDVAGTLYDRRLEIVVGVQDWNERETEPQVQIFGLYEKGRTSVQYPPLAKSQGADGVTYFKGYVTAERGMHLATYEVQVNWAKYTDGTPVRMSPPVETYQVFDSNPDYNENQSYKNRAFDGKKEFENKLSLYANGIKTAEQSLAGLQYDSPEAQKKIKDAWDVRWMAVTKLDSITTNLHKAITSLENGKFKDAALRFETIEKTSGHLEDDLKWISDAISDAEKLEEQHKTFGFFGSAFDSQEGSNCIWFICW